MFTNTIGGKYIFITFDLYPELKNRENCSKSYCIITRQSFVCRVRKIKYFRVKCRNGIAVNNNVNLETIFTRACVYVRLYRYTICQLTRGSKIKSIH